MEERITVAKCCVDVQETESECVLTSIVRPAGETSPKTPCPINKPNRAPLSNKRKRTPQLPPAPRKDLKKAKIAAKTLEPPAMSERKKAIAVAAATASAAAGARETGKTLDPFEKMQKFMENQFTMTNENITAISESVSTLNTKCNANTEKLIVLQNAAEKNQNELSALYGVIGEKDKKRQEEIAILQQAVVDLKRRDQGEIRQQIRDQVTNTIEKTYAQAIAQQPTPKGSKTPDKETKFWLSRRSIRCWPVHGKQNNEMRSSLMKFFEEKLKIPSGIVFDQDVETIRRAVNGSRFSKVVDEVIVVFNSVGIRDTVTSYARNLAAWVDDKNDPLAGIRLEIPDHLAGIHKNLKIYGGLLRKEHGVGLKRNIRFDDTALTLHMDVKLPGSDDWINVDNEMAKEARQENDRSATATARRRLMSSTSSAEVVMLSPPPTSRRSPPPRGPPLSNTLTKFPGTRPGWGEK